MIKLIALLKAKQGMNREAFIERYEQRHAPLIVDLIPFFTAYRRSYPTQPMAPHHIKGTSLPDDFDVITELWYPDRAAIDDQVAALEGAIGRRVFADEEEQFERSHMIMFEADEHVTSSSGLRPRPVDRQGPPPIRATAMLRKRPGMTRDDFIAYYETNHVRLVLETIAKDSAPLFAQYTRSYPLPDSAVRIGSAGDAPELDFDVITDMWFWSDADYRAFLTRPEDPAVAAALATDELELFDRDKMQAFLTDEFFTAPETIKPVVDVRPA